MLLYGVSPQNVSSFAKIEKKNTNEMYAISHLQLFSSSVGKAAAAATAAEICLKQTISTELVWVLRCTAVILTHVTHFI